MRPGGPTFWLLDGRVGFRTGTTSGVIEDADVGLRLDADPDGPLSLPSDDGSLGQLVLPSFVAIDGDHRVYLLATERPLLRRFDPAADAFVPIPSTGEEGQGARDLSHPVAVAAGGRNLIVADQAPGRVLVFHTDSLALRAVWHRPRGSESGRPWTPISIWATPTGAGYVLDAAGVVWLHPSPAAAPIRIEPQDGDDGRWTRLAVDDEGLLYLLSTSGLLWTFDGAGRAVGEPSADRGTVVDRFQPPAVSADHRGRIGVPPWLRSWCPGPPNPADRPGLEQPAELQWYDRSSGTASAPQGDDWLGPRSYLRSGTWISEALDSQIHNCQWHKIKLDLGRLAAGSRVEIATFSAAEPLTPNALTTVDESLWETIPPIVADSQPDPGRPPTVDEIDAAVRSREGRYLWLRLTLSGDGYDTPTIAAARVHYPRRSDIDLLPPIFSADDGARRFTERFLSLMRTQLEPVEETIRNIGALFDPDAAPPSMVGFLASWLDLAGEGDWSVDQHRHLLGATSPVLCQRGTPEALAAHVRAYLENMVGIELDDRSFPRLVEGYRRRNHIMLTNRTELSGRTAVWSDGIEARLRLDQQRAGPVRLVSIGDPDRDFFHHYAHSFRVVIPAAWVETATDERMIRRAVESEKPAHTTYELSLVTPGIRLGDQSTVGIDTVIGALPTAKLSCHHAKDAAPSRPPRHRLGVDTVLCGGDPPARPLRAGDRIGDNAVLI